MMKFFADARLVDSLFSGRHSILVDSGLLRHESYGLDATIFRATIDDDAVTFAPADLSESNGDVEIVELHEPPSTVMTIVLRGAREHGSNPVTSVDFLEKTAETSAAKLVDWLSGYRKKAQGNTDRPFMPVVYREDEVLNPQRLLEICLNAANRNTEALLSYGDTVARELFLIRDEAEQLHRANSDLSKVVYSVGARLPACRYYVPPSGDVIELEQGHQQIEQLLGLPTRGFCAVDLHLHGEMAMPDEELMVSIKALETETVLARWTLRAGDLARGWNRFILRNCLGGHNFTAILKIDGLGQNLVAISQGVDSLFVPPASHVGRPLKRSLAFRVWSGLPNALTMKALQSPERKLSETKLDLGDIYPHLKTADIDPHPGFEVVLRNDEDTLLLHPVTNFIVSSSIKASDLCPVNFVALALDVEAAHLGAPLLEVALWTGSETEFAKFANAPADEIYSRIDSWLTLSPLQKITLEVNGIMGGSDIVVMFSKLKNIDEGQDFAWTHWSNFRVVYEHGQHAQVHIGASESI